MAFDLKAYIEKRNAKFGEASAIAEKAIAETRAMTADEQKNYDIIVAEVDAMDTTIVSAKGIEDRAMKRGTTVPNGNDKEIEKRELADFEFFCRHGFMQSRAGEQDFSSANNSAVIPKTIANKIVDAIKDICPIFAGAEGYHIPGTIAIPVYGNAGSSSNQNISCGYASEFAQLTGNAGKLTTVDIGGHLASVLTKISENLPRNMDLDIVSFIIMKIAELKAEWIEHEMLVGVGTETVGGASVKRCTGVTVGCTNTKTLSAATYLTGDDLIALQLKVKGFYQRNACWTMSPSTLEVIRKLKDGQGRYLVVENFAKGADFGLLGKPINVSDNMPNAAASAKSLLYGDYSGMAYNMAWDDNIRVLDQKYADENAIGFRNSFLFDCNVVNNQKLAVGIMASTDPATDASGGSGIT